jgi:DNA helicase HerA-like ATPase
VQHALRAFTPLEQKAVKAAAETFRPNPKLRVEDVIGNLGVGEALVSTLQADGTPSMVERAKIAPPRSRIGAITPEERAAVMQKSPIAGHYDTAIDRESAYERLVGRTQAPQAAARQRTGPAPVRADDPWGGILLPTRNFPPPEPMPPPRAPRGRAAAPPPPEPDGSLGGILASILVGDGKRQGAAEAMAKSAARSMGSSVGRQISTALVRGVLGSLMRK